MLKQEVILSRALKSHRLLFFMEMIKFVRKCFGGFDEDFTCSVSGLERPAWG